MGKGAGVRSCCLSLVVVAGVVGLAKVACSQSQALDIAIPTSLGYVSEVHQPVSSTLAASSDASHAPATIIHIQDAHTNYEAQRHIVSILEGLIKEHGLKLIMVEGSEGDVSLAYLRRYGPLENRKQVADKYLKAGIISAEEYLDIVSDHPLILWGIEQKDLYDLNVEAFLAAESLRDSLQPLLVSTREAIKQLKPLVSDAAITTLEEKAKAFDQHTLNLSDYADALDQAAKRQGLTLKDYPNLSRFIEVRHVEQTLALDRVKEQQRQLVGRLGDLLAEEQLKPLIAAAGQLKEGKTKPVVFYTQLKELSAKAVVDVAKEYPELSAYMTYVLESDHINATVLAKELDGCSAFLRAKLPASQESRQLSAIAEEVDLIDKLLDLRLSPEEYRRLDALDLKTLVTRWDTFLNGQLRRQKLPERSFGHLDTLEAKLPTLQRFYEAAQNRDAALARNTVAKMRETGEPLAVLITGGFHSPQLTKLLNEGGVASMVVTPKVSHPTDERLYRAVVKYKSGHGSYDEVMSIANQANLAKAVAN